MTEEEKVEEEIRKWENFYKLVWGEVYKDWEPPVEEDEEDGDI